MHAAGGSLLLVTRVASPPPASASLPFHLVVYERVLARERLRAPLQGPICPSEAF